MGVTIGLLRGVEFDEEEPTRARYDDERDLHVSVSDGKTPLVRTGAVLARTETLTKTIRDVPDED